MNKENYDTTTGPNNGGRTIAITAASARMMLVSRVVAGIHGSPRGRCAEAQPMDIVPRAPLRGGHWRGRKRVKPEATGLSRGAPYYHRLVASEPRQEASGVWFVHLA